MSSEGDAEETEARIDLPLPKVGSIFGGYRLEKELGRGATATVFRARRLQDGQSFALKTLQARYWGSGRLYRRMLREARVLTELRHPNVVRILDAGGPPEAPPYLVTELVPGPSLAVVIKRSAPVSPQRTAQLMLQMARGLEAAHGLGIIHRDVKPANAIVTHSGEAEVVKLFDFGLARAVEEEVHGTVFTSAGDFLGTPAYMSPEQIRDPSRVGPATDLYALGLIGHELYLGHRPTNRPKNINALVGADLTPPPLPGGGPLPKLIEQLLAVDPEARPGSAGSVAAALEAMLPTLEAEPEPELEPSRVTRAIQRLDLPSFEWSRASWLLIRRDQAAPISRFLVALGLLAALTLVSAAVYFRAQRAPRMIPVLAPTPAAPPPRPSDPIAAPTVAARPQEPSADPRPAAPSSGPEPPLDPVPPPPELNRGAREGSASGPSLEQGRQQVARALAQRGLRPQELSLVGVSPTLWARYEAAQARGQFGSEPSALVAAIEGARLGPELVRARLQVVLQLLEQRNGDPKFEDWEARYFELRSGLSAEPDQASCLRLLKQAELLERSLRDRGPK